MASSREDQGQSRGKPALSDAIRSTPLGPCATPRPLDILNFAKVLRALFGEHPTESMNRVRTGLRGLGYAGPDIERLYIAAMAM